MTSSSSTKKPTSPKVTTLSRRSEKSGGEYREDLPQTSSTVFWRISATPAVVRIQACAPPRTPSRSSGRTARRSSPQPMSARATTTPRTATGKGKPAPRAASDRKAAAIRKSPWPKFMRAVVRWVMNRPLAVRV